MQRREGERPGGATATTPPPRRGERSGAPAPPARGSTLHSGPKRGHSARPCPVLGRTSPVTRQLCETSRGRPCAHGRGVAWPAPAGLAETVERGDCAGSPLPTLPAGHAGHPLPRPSPTAKSRMPNPQPRSLPGQPRPGSRPIPLRAATPAHPGVTQPLGVRRRRQQRPVARPCGERGNVPRPGVGRSPAAPGDLCTPALTVTNRNVERCSPREPRRPRGPRARSGWRVTLPAGGRRAGGDPAGSRC